MLMTLAEFIHKSGLRKISVAVYMFGLICWLLHEQRLDVKTFGDISLYLILAVFGGNSLEHFFKSKGEKNGQPGAEAAKPGP